MIVRLSRFVTSLALVLFASACGGPAERPAGGASPAATPTVAAAGGSVPSMPASPAGAATQYDIRGKVESVASDRQAVTLDHEAIPGLMAAMKMEYRVSDASVLQGLKAGDRVHGRLEARTGGEYVVLTLQKH